jgi:hypothetical protein
MTGAFAQLTVTGAVSTSAIFMSGATAQATVTGAVSNLGIDMQGTSAQLTVTGDVTAGTSTSFHGVWLSGASSNADITGTMTSTNASHAVLCGGQAVLDGDLIDAPNGRVAVFAPLQRVRISTNVRTVHRTPEISNADGSPVIRASLDYITNNVPVPADVREGTVYADDQFEGTLAVPPANAVGAGVPVDDTVGTAALSLEAVAALIAAYDPSES